MAPERSGGAAGAGRDAAVGDDKLAILVGAEGPGLTETAMRASDARPHSDVARHRLAQRESPPRRRWRSTNALGSRRDPRTDTLGHQVDHCPVSSRPSSEAAVVVLGLGLIPVHPLLAIGLNLVAAGSLAPTVWGWRSVR